MTQIQESELLANEQTNSKRKRSDLIEECATRTEENEIDNRRRRRQSAAFQQRRKSLVTYNNINDDKSSQRFGEIYARIIKLSSENKINVKNSWSLQLIDYMHDILETSTNVSVKQQETYNFMKASCTLDASIKIYSYRVDDTWNSSYKVLENLSRNEGKKDLATEDEKKKKEKKNRKMCKDSGASSTLEKNITNINMKKMDLDYNVDPLFHKMSKQFDEGGARGMLLTNLSIYDGCKLLLNSSDVMASSRLPSAINLVGSTEKSIQETEIDIAMLVKDLPTDTSERQLCPAIERLYMQLEQLTDTNNASIYSPAIDEENGGNLVKDLEADKDKEGIVDPVDADFDLSVEIEGSEASDEMTERNPATISICENPEQSAPLSAAEYFHRRDQIQMQQNNDSDTFHQLLNTLSSSDYQASTEQAYSYFGLGSSTKWTRRSHWKFPSRFNKRKSQVSLSDATLDDNSQSKDEHTTTRKRGNNKEKRKSTTIDFFIDEERSSGELTSCKSSKDIVFSKEAIRRQIKQAEKLILPVDAHITAQHFQRYFLKPCRSCFIFRKEQMNEVKSFSYMETAKDPHFGLRARADSVDDNEVEYHYESDREDENQPALLTADRLVPIVDINYERTAKRVNVRRLKQKIWDHLKSDRIAARDIDAVSDSVDKENWRQREKLTADERPPLTTCFKSVVNTLRSETNSDTTMSFYFICLLHLANEKGLELTGQDSLENFGIQSSKK